MDFAYADCIKIIGGLLTTIQDQQRTRQTFTAILNQAAELDKSSLWVEREVKFEILAELATFDWRLFLGRFEAKLQFDHG